MTLVRPSHTYCGGKAVVALHGARGCWQTLARIRAGKPVIIPGDGTSLWTATHADDFAVGFVGLMGNPHALGTAVHITTDEGMTWNQIYAVLASAMGAPLCAAYVASKFLAVCGRAAGYDFEGPLLGDKAANVRFDNTKIKRLVPDFAPRVSWPRVSAARWNICWRTRSCKRRIRSSTPVRQSPGGTERGQSRI